VQLEEADENEDAGAPVQREMSADQDDEEQGAGSPAG